MFPINNMVYKFYIFAQVSRLRYSIILIKPVHFHDKDCGITYVFTEVDYTESTGLMCITFYLIVMYAVRLTGTNFNFHVIYLHKCHLSMSIEIQCVK